MSAPPLPNTRPAGWIVSARFDLLFFFASAVLALSLGALMLWQPALTLPLWFAWLWLIEGPHLFATWQRTYFDPPFRQQHATLLQTSLLWLLPAPLLLLLSRYLGQSLPFQLILALAAVWSFHHAIRQHHGLLAIYQRVNQATRSASLGDKYLLHGILWAAFILFLLHNPHNRAELGLSEISPWQYYLQQILPILLAAAILFWGKLLLLRWRAGAAVKPGLFGLLVAVGVTLFALFVIGPHEPLLADARSTEQIFIAATIVSGTLHGVQYLGIVIATSRRRAQQHGRAASPPSLAQRMGRWPLLAYLLLLALSVPYVCLNLARGGAPIDGFSISTEAQQNFLALYWGVFFHHYWLDQKIWKPSSDPQLRAELELQS